MSSVVCALSAAVVAGAQEPQPPGVDRWPLVGPAASVAGPPLSLGEAIAEALERNPELRALRRQFIAMQARPRQERFLAAPTFEAQIWQWPIDTLNPADARMYMFSVGQQIPGPGKRRLREALAEQDAALAEADIAVRARDVIERVKHAYADLFLARKAIEVNEASVELLRQLAEVAQARYATGRISQQDVLKAVVELSRVHDELITLDEQARLAEAQLNALLDRPPAAPLGSLAEPRTSVSLPAPETLQELALAQQPELRRARLGTARADAQRAVVDREATPDFFAMGGYMAMPGDRDAWMAKVGVTWPNAPWSRGRLDARRAEAEAQVAAAQARADAVENALRLAVQQAYVRVGSAERRAALLRTTIVPQAEQTLAVSRVAYQNDRVEFLAIIDNERVRLDAHLEYYRALADLEQALAELERTVGADLTQAQAAPADEQGGR